MIKETKVEISINPVNKNYYVNKGYNAKCGENLIVDTIDLNHNSKTRVTAICSKCGKEVPISYQKYNCNYNRYGFYTCRICSTIKKEMTTMKNHGVTNSMKSKKIQDKSIETKSTRYENGNYDTSKFKATCQERYGCDHHLQNKDILQKHIDTNNKLYGVDYSPQRQSSKDKTKAKHDKNSLSRSAQLYHNKYGLIIKNKIGNDYILDCDVCGKEYQISFKLLGLRLFYSSSLCTICNPIGYYKISQGEIEVSDFIKSIYTSEIITNSKRIIKPHELDCYIPYLNLAFEYNGVYWHNENNKPNNFHINKSNICDDYNIELVHIWEDDWMNKNELIKNIIRDKLNLIVKKTLSNFIIKIVKTIDAVKFIENNNIRLCNNSIINLGLYNNGVLVSILSYNILPNNDIDIISYTELLDNHYDDSLKILFDYLLLNYNPNTITFISDRTYGQTKNFTNIGFLIHSITKPNIYYIDKYIRYIKNNNSNRVNWVNTIHDAGNYKLIYVNK